MSTKSLKELKEELKNFVNITALKQWIADGEPYEEDDDILLFKEQIASRNGITHSGTKSKSTDFSSTLTSQVNPNISGVEGAERDAHSRAEETGKIAQSGPEGKSTGLCQALIIKAKIKRF